MERQLATSSGLSLLVAAVSTVARRSTDTTANSRDGPSIGSSTQDLAQGLTRPLQDTHRMITTVDRSACAKALGVPAQAAGTTSPSRVRFRADMNDTERLVRSRLNEPDADAATDSITAVLADFWAPVTAAAA